MAKKIDWMAKLSTLKGAINEARDVHATVIQSRSPSLNFLYGNGWGLPLGYSLVLYGPPKAGKSLITYEMIAQTHRDYPDGWVIKFNTEFREQGQLTPEMMRIYGIDEKRYKAIETNHPAEIYDQIEQQLDAWCKDGLPVKLVIIDSMNSIQGRRAIEAEKSTVMTQQIGDVALTNKEGLKRILPIQRRHNFSLVMTSHVAVEMDPIEQKRGNKYRMGASIGVQHHAEYFMFVEPNRNKAGRVDMLGQEMVDASKKDLNGEKAERTGHKIRVVMKDSSMGPKGRFAEFTFDYHKGIVNQHEEVFLLGKNRGVIQKDGGHYYTIPGYTMPDVHGEKAMLKFLADDTKAQEHVLRELRRQDLAGLQAAYDAQDEAAWATPKTPDVPEKEA